MQERSCSHKMGSLLEELCYLSLQCDNVLDTINDFDDNSLKNTVIFDVSEFLFYLKINNLLTPHLEKAIREYMRFYN